MKIFAQALGLLAIVSPVLAQVGNDIPIFNALVAVDNATSVLDQDILAWSGDRRGFTKIFWDAQGVLWRLYAAQQAATAAPVLTEDESLDLATLLLVGDSSLATVVNKTLEDAINALPKFNALYVTPIVLRTVEQLQNATDKFGAILVPKADPADGLPPIAQEIIDQFDGYFDTAIQAIQAAVDSLPKNPNHGWGWKSFGNRPGRGWGWW